MRPSIILVCASFTLLHFVHFTFVSSSPNNELADTNKLKGKRVAVFQAQLCGNLGDVMETTPLLVRLHQWGVRIDIFAATWLKESLRIDSRLTHPFQYVENLYLEPPPAEDTAFYAKYDVFIVAPGPDPSSTQSLPCMGSIPLVWFGTSVYSSYLAMKLSKCLALITVREPYSVSKLELEMTSQKAELPPMLMTGDYSNSYEPIHSLLQYWTTTFASVIQQAKLPSDWVLVFSRSNNFIHDDNIRLKNSTHPTSIDEARRVFIFTTIDEEHEVSVPLDKIVFATSDYQRDEEYFYKLQNHYKISPLRLITLDTIEAMWGIITNANHVYSDRYHPCVSTLILDKKLTVMYYKSEYVKMKGIHEMKKYDSAEIKRLNEKGFGLLQDIIENSDTALRRLGKVGRNLRSE